MAIVTVNLTSESYMHLSEVLGVCVQGTAPNVQINRAVQDVVDALHEVVAGGVVTNKTVVGNVITLEIQKGSPFTKNKLDTMLAACLMSINQINAATPGLVLEV